MLGSTDAAAKTGHQVVARWEDAASLVILKRWAYRPLPVMLISKTLNTRARAAIKRALRLETLRRKAVADAREASQKARVGESGRLSAVTTSISSRRTTVNERPTRLTRRDGLYPGASSRSTRPGRSVLTKVARRAGVLFGIALLLVAVSRCVS